MSKAKLRLLKSPQIVNEIRDEDAAELNRWETLIALSIAGHKEAEERIKAKIAAGAAMNLKDWTWNGERFERVMVARAGGTK